MVAPDVPERLTWAVALLDVAPGHQVLEVGCGRGVAAARLLERLADGTLTAIDRSATAIRAATARNADAVSAGRARFHVSSLEAVDLGDVQFDRILAVNVNLFWVADPVDGLASIRRMLAADGVFVLVYEPPSTERASMMATRLQTGFTRHGLAIESRSGRTSTGASLLGLVARHAG